LLDRLLSCVLATASSEKCLCMKQDAGDRREGKNEIGVSPASGRTPLTVAGCPVSERT
jgi:hypothetical protein